MTLEGVTSGPLQVWFDDQLMGPTSDGVYIDDVFVGGVDFSDTFDTAGSPGWTTYSAPGVIADNQWEHGSPHNPIGPMAPHSSWGLWGTDIDGDYQRGAWSFLVSPTMDFSEDVTYNLTFWAWWNVYWEDDFAYVLASDDGGATWDEENAMVFMGSSLSHLYWSRFDFNLTAYQGSDDVRLAFVFYSVPKTLNVRHDATFRFSGLVSMTTKAGPRTITVVFEGNLFFQGLAEETELGVRQRAEFSFPPFARDKIGYRNKEITINASLVDSTGAIVDNQLTGEPEVFKVHIHWDPTWTIEDGKGEAVGPPVTVGEGGEVRANYTVPWDHVLGPARVTFAFLGGTYYEPVEQTDIYYVKAETYFLAPPSQYRITFRGQPVEITADLRIVIDQSIDKLEPGDPLSGEFVKVFWNGDQIGNRRTTFEGSFSIDYLVPSTFELGAVNVTFEYEGQSLYEPMTTSFEYRVVSETSMVFVDREVYKGTWVQMFGSLHDDKAQPLVGVQVSLDWRGGSQVLTTDAEGEFSFDHFVEFGDKVGNVTVTAKFGGNNLYLASSVSATYTYKIGTVLVRQDHVRTAMRGEQIQVSARLYEQWGDLRGVEVQREVVTLLIDDMVVSYKRTAFDGSVTFTAPMEVDKFPYGEVNLTLVFTGTEFLEPAMNVTPLVIRARAVLTYAELRVNGELFNQIDERVHYQDEVYGRVLLQDSNFQPIPYQTVAAYYKEADPRATKRIIQSSQTDSQGYFEFDWTFVNRYNGRMSLIVEFAGTREATTYDPDAIIVEPVTSYYNFTYDSPGVEPHDFEVDTDGDRRVAPGAELVLLVILQDPGDWNPGTLNYSLVDPPAGMTITSDGIIKWTPGEGDEGDHTITVRIYDGDRTETAKIKITVGEEGSAREETRVIVAFIAAGLIIAIVVIIGLVMMFRDRE